MFIKAPLEEGFIKEHIEVIMIGGVDGI